MKAVYIRTVEDLDAEVTIGNTKESTVLEFKETIDGWNRPKAVKNYQGLKLKAQLETCRDIAQFANTNGGCLLIGVKERLDPATGLKLATGFERVSKPENMKAWIEQAIANYLVPATFAHPINILRDSKRTVVAINIPPSLHLVALWHSDKSQFEEKHSIEYLYRDSHGKKWMNPDDVERHIMNGSRAARLSFDLALSEASSTEVKIAGGCWWRADNTGTGASDQRWSPRCETGGATDLCFELKFPIEMKTLSLALPYGVVREVWVGTDGCLNLLLSVRIIYQFDKLSIEPYF